MGPRTSGNSLNRKPGESNNSGMAQVKGGHPSEQLPSNSKKSTKVLRDKQKLGAFINNAVSIVESWSKKDD